MNKKKLMVVIDILLGAILVGIMTFGIYQYLKSDGEKFKAEYEALNNENVNINISKIIQLNMQLWMKYLILYKIKQE